ncbi:MAG: HutD family protein [Rhizobiaceae bacterium]|nr:HutD family protein [Rhizobiaceae bacterium]
MRLVRSADHRATPWKNGGGTTVEIAVHPPGASVDEFEWRLSMATVATDGPFSVFADIDRTLTVLDGEGIVLDVAGQPPVTLTPRSPPHVFPGDVATGSWLVGGPVRDLNIMTRRRKWRHRVTSMTFSEKPAELDVAQIALLFCVRGGLAIRCRSGAASLDPLDTLALPAGPCGCAASGPGGASALLVQLADW